jgi:xanthine dehydrogenase accessory factor
MNKELDLWQFIADRIGRNESVMLLVVAESSGSSPGRQGYKMAVSSDGELCGSIGGGVMEVNLVDGTRTLLSSSPQSGEMSLREQVHRKDVPNSSGMICSGKQTVIFKLLTPEDNEHIEKVIDALTNRRPDILKISTHGIAIEPPEGGTQNADFTFERLSDDDFTYTEKLGFKNDLYIIGGGHCALALSELMSKMDFHISLFDDRPDLNTIDKNRFAHEIEIIDGYERIGNKVPSGKNIYVVVMTLGYKSDEIVIRQLVDKKFKYFGVLGSKAKMATLISELKNDGISSEKIDQIHTPIGVSINSRTPEEIAVSIAAEIIAVKNAD